MGKNILQNKLTPTWKDRIPGGKRPKIKHMPWMGEMNNELRAMGTKRVGVLPNKMFSNNYNYMANFTDNPDNRLRIGDNGRLTIGGKDWMSLSPDEWDTHLQDYDNKLTWRKYNSKQDAHRAKIAKLEAQGAYRELKELDPNWTPSKSFNRNAKAKPVSPEITLPPIDVSTVIQRHSEADRPSTTLGRNSPTIPSSTSSNPVKYKQHSGGGGSALPLAVGGIALGATGLGLGAAYLYNKHRQEQDQENYGYSYATMANFMEIPISDEGEDPIPVVQKPTSSKKKPKIATVESKPNAIGLPEVQANLNLKSLPDKLPPVNVTHTLNGGSNTATNMNINHNIKLNGLKNGILLGGTVGTGLLGLNYYLNRQRDKERQADTSSYVYMSPIVEFSVETINDYTPEQFKKLPKKKRQEILDNSQYDTTPQSEEQRRKAAEKRREREQVLTTSRETRGWLNSGLSGIREARAWTR